MIRLHDSAKFNVDSFKEVHYINQTLVDRDKSRNLQFGLRVTNWTTKQVEGSY